MAVRSFLESWRSVWFSGVPVFPVLVLPRINTRVGTLSPGLRRVILIPRPPEVTVVVAVVTGRTLEAAFTVVFDLALVLVELFLPPVLAGAALVGVVLAGAALAGVVLAGAALAEVVLAGAALAGVDFTGVVLAGALA
ncbi:MAG: pentapeptide repeat-containing protein [Planctomycetota bacterium]|nr:pentapeptide repeat-containing protein [Planctomycetota bacterium]